MTDKLELDAPSQPESREVRPTDVPRCPQCSTPLDLQDRDRDLWWCSWCRRFIDPPVQEQQADASPVPSK